MENSIVTKCFKEILANDSQMFDNLKKDLCIKTETYKETETNSPRIPNESASDFINRMEKNFLNKMWKTK